MTLSLFQSLHACTLPLYLNVDLFLIPETRGGSGTVPDHGGFSCMCVISVVQCLWFKYMSCCVPYGQNYPSQGTRLQAGHLDWDVSTHTKPHINTLAYTHTRTFLCTHDQTTHIFSLMWSIGHFQSSVLLCVHTHTQITLAQLRSNRRIAPCKL